MDVPFISPPHHSSSPCPAPQQQEEQQQQDEQEQQQLWSPARVSVTPSGEGAIWGGLHVSAERGMMTEALWPGMELLSHVTTTTQVQGFTCTCCLHMC